jgi:hypothetical protein
MSSLGKSAFIQINAAHKGLQLLHSRPGICASAPPKLVSPRISLQFTLTSVQLLLPVTNPVTFSDSDAQLVSSDTYRGLELTVEQDHSFKAGQHEVYITGLGPQLDGYRPVLKVGKKRAAAGADSGSDGSIGSSRVLRVMCPHPNPGLLSMEDLRRELRSGERRAELRWVYGFLGASLQYLQVWHLARVCCLSILGLLQLMTMPWRRAPRQGMLVREGVPGDANAPVRKGHSSIPVPSNV